MKIINIVLLIFIVINSSCYNIDKQKNKLLRISEDGHTFSRADGKPVFWLGDTAWELFHRLNEKEADFYLEKRSSQGFNVIQAVALSELKGLTEPNRMGELPLLNKDPNTPNDKYFEFIDYVIDKAASLDMYIAILPTWGKYWSDYKIFDTGNAFNYGKYMGDRYKNRWNIIWILGGDRIPKTGEQYEIIRQMAMGLKSGDGGTHLISVHPAGNNTSLSFFQYEKWIDFHMAQSGHAHRDMPNFLYALNNNLVKPSKPFIDGEPRYEDLPVKFWEVQLPGSYPDNPVCIPDSLTPYGYFNSYDVRRAAYWSVFSGAAGFTYGNGSIWCFWDEGRYAPIAVKYSWQKAMDSPGGEQMQFLKKLIDKYGTDKLYPDRSVIVDNWSLCTNYQCALITKDRKSVLVYSPQGEHIRIAMEKLLPGNVSYRWYNPRNGLFSPPQKVVGDSLVVEFHPPSQGTDWILTLNSEI